MVGDAEHRFLAADLASMTATASLADAIGRQTDPVDALVCCAGIFALRPEWTDEGLERTFALNYLSRFPLGAGSSRSCGLVLGRVVSSRMPAPTVTVSISTTRTTGTDDPACASPSDPVRQRPPRGRIFF